MAKPYKDLLILFSSLIGLTFLIWLPHIFRINLFGLDFSEGFNTIYRNFDGLEYIIIAKSFYNPDLIAALPQSLPAGYFASHFPGFSIFILLFAPILGFLKSMLFVSLIFTFASLVAFYFLVRNFKLTNHPLLLSLIFLILPARWVIVHSVGSSEPTFIFFVIMAFYFFLKFEESKKFSDILLTGIFGFFAQITRPPGILLFIALSLYLLWKNRNNFKLNFLFVEKLRLYFPLSLIPTGLVGVFLLFNYSYGDFFAYFKSGDNIHLFFPPYQIFNKMQYWVGDIWLEDVVYIYLLGFLSGILLIKQKLYPLAFFVFTFMSASAFVAHRDISRYVLPIFPFALIAFEKILTSKEFRIVLLTVVLAIYLYAQNFILSNTAPIPNLETFN